jgi:predicted Zn-dependent protease
MSRRSSLLACLVVLIGAASCTLNRPQSEKRAVSYKENEEVRISREFRREAKKNLKFVRNLEVERYVDQIGRRILSTMGPQPFDYRFFVVEERELNAFAIPGGSVYIYTGLLEKMHSTDEVAGVVGHEIIHIKGRHMARMSGPDLLSLAGLLGIFLGGGGGAQAVGAIGQAVSVTRQLSYLRQLEQEADTLGIKYMSAAGYDPQAALAFLRTIDQERVLNPVDVPPYLTTHPLGQERISNAEATIRALNLERPRTHAEDPIKKIQLLVRLDRGEAPVLISELEAQAKQTEQNAETKHLLAIAYHQSGNQQKALQNYEAALELDARRPGINRDLGRLYIQMGELRLAREAVNRAINAEPKDALNYLYLGELSEKESSLRDAAGAYLNAHHLAPLWPEPLQRLGTVYGKINRLGDAYYYLGRSLLLQEEDETALVQWERALKVFGEKTPRGQALKAEIDALRERRS